MSSIRRFDHVGITVADLDTAAAFFVGLGFQVEGRMFMTTGTVCGIRVEDVEDPLMQKIRYLDKLVDELAKGRPMEKVLRS